MLRVAFLTALLKVQCGLLSLLNLQIESMGKYTILKFYISLQIELNVTTKVINQNNCFNPYPAKVENIVSS
jgi:hypothetical protein